MSGIGDRRYDFLAPREIDLSEFMSDPSIAHDKPRNQRPSLLCDIGLCRSAAAFILRYALEPRIRKPSDSRLVGF